MLVLSMVYWNNVQVRGCNFYSTISCHHQASEFFWLMGRLTCSFRASLYSSSSCFFLAKGNFSLWFSFDAQICYDLCGLANEPYSWLLESENHQCEIAKQ